MGKLLRRIFNLFLLIIAAGYIVPPYDKPGFPFIDTSQVSWDKKSYWYYPWGNSRVHKGVDIFAGKGTKIVAPTFGVVISSGYGNVAGNYIYLLGPRWNVYYFAHLDSITLRGGAVKRGTVLGMVGNTGNAEGKPFHLHFSVYSVVPHVWLYENTYMGWGKMFYLNPLTHCK